MPQRHYVKIRPNEPLPACDIDPPFKAIVCVESLGVKSDWRMAVSTWLVENGCLFALAWGEACAEWERDIDEANLLSCDYQSVPDDQLVMTTWHNSGPLSEVVWFAKNVARHPCVELDNILMVHIGDSEKQAQFMRLLVEPQCVR